ncbi:15808_t:CDS:2 [Acaulospora morrowiae]|uniref:15808_t:CDS:1 n=1 Tax=Acaulospora morrowiae TaxID=94023 RepID=A0A9N8W056_9GLOM|nr:15808_t:CDS:2 [Acaulospora morrowiae]
MKIDDFNQTDGLLQYDQWVEYLFVGVIWLTIPIVYTYFTSNEMGDIPFVCPSSYTYPSEAVEDACKIRKGNLICMWIYYVILVMMTMTGFPRIFYYIDDDYMDDDYNEGFREGEIMRRIDLGDSEEKSFGLEI